MSWASLENTNTSTIWNYVHEKPASYIVRVNGSYYEAINGTTGKISYGGSGNNGGATGTDALAVIQAAIDAVESSGGTVIVKGPDTYGFTDALTIQGSHVELVGVGAPLLQLITPTNESIIDVGVSPNTYENVKVHGIRMDGAATIGYGVLFRYGITDSYIQNCYIQDCNMGVDLDNACHRNWVENNTITSGNAEAIGVGIYRSNDCTITKNKCITIGAATGGRGINLEEATLNTVSENVIKGMVRTTAYGDGINLLTNATENLIVENIVADNGGHGINFEGALGNAADNVLKGNIVRNNSKNGIYVNGSTGTQIVGGLVKNSGEQGINLSSANNTKVSNVDIITNSQGGIYLYKSSYCQFNRLFMHNNTEDADATYTEIKTETDATPCSYNDFSNFLVISDNASKRATFLYADENAANDYNTLRNSRWVYGGTTICANVLGPHTIGDLLTKAPLSLDLSAAGTDLVVWHAPSNATLLGYKLLYTEASSADAGVTVEVGRYQDGVALDDDYFDQSTSEVTQALGYCKTFVSSDLTNKALTAGDTVTVGTAGGKTGTGEVLVILNILLG